jgi:hypothetical protein
MATYGIILWNFVKVEAVRSEKEERTKAGWTFLGDFQMTAGMEFWSFVRLELSSVARTARTGTGATC